MALWHGTSKRTPSGGRRIRHQKKRRREIGRETAPTTIDEDERVKARVHGGGEKTRAVSVEQANVTDPETGETEPADIETVVENPANPHFVRRNFITKGAVIETEKGPARVTSRPGQHGDVNAVLVEE
ncbi:30S ribosomal protein S8e [Thermoplasmatales archaeon SW_10_69_26]|jgi:small subunit ribosomal protein S8e|nr:MAG: 30S ribosomal protein S8e [Thermoplasmatales archaeon SW_10_69_26]